MKNTDNQNRAQAAQEIRKDILNMIHAAGNGHPGGSLSLVEILVTLLGDDGVMNWSDKNPENQDRDRLVLSKGHGVPALYAAYAHFGDDIKKQELNDLRTLGSRLQGHPDRERIPYLEASTGSLGQGASVAQGIAMGQKLAGSSFQTYAIVGDGEIQEGQIWEMAMSAPFHKLSNLTLIIDYNKGQIDGATQDVLDLEPLADKWKAFNWHVIEVDGHSYEELEKAFTVKTDAPKCIICHTIKGKGVSFMEGKISWHGQAPDDEQLKLALEELT